MIIFGFGPIGLEVKAVHRESEAEQKILGFFFKGFWLSNEVIIFHGIP